MNIILCGYQGCGKTTVSKAFSESFGYDYLDTDNLICKDSTKSVRELHLSLGETAFRELENKTVRSIKNITNSIIATGGGVLINTDNVNHLKKLGQIIYLYLDPEVILSRMLQQETLPNFIKKANIQQDFERYIDSRKEIYASHSDHQIDTTNRTVDEVVFSINQYRCNHGK